ncbi:MAG: serine/threonine-protein kinase [Gaiellaceae bacterium]
MAEEMIAGRYRLLEPLGRGAMSSVWLAQDEELARRVAVKMLGPTADRTRFEREARAVAALSHPNIGALYDYGEAAGRPYMVLEYLQNGSLEDRLRKGALSDDETLRIATEMAAGLAHAHDRGLVHRDLKPANVLFDAEDRAKIADFGIARVDGGGTFTEAGTVLGTASYISPEQASGLPAGPASDVYSFGVILFRMLTGRLPFVSTNAMELVRMHRDDAPPALSDVRRDAPVRLEEIVAASLAKDPLDRPPDGQVLLRALRGTAEDATALLAPGAGAATAATQIMPPPLTEPPPPARRRPRALWLVPLRVLLLGAGVALALVATGGGDSAPATSASIPSLSLPTVPTAGSTPLTTATAAATTATATTEATTTLRTTTEATTSTAPTTTAPSTTSPTTTAPTTTAAATTAPPPPTTTAPPPTTTVAPPPTTTSATTTAATPTTTDTTATITIPIPSP